MGAHATRHPSHGLGGSCETHALLCSGRRRLFRCVMRNGPPRRYTARYQHGSAQTRTDPPLCLPCVDRWRWRSPRSTCSPSPPRARRRRRSSWWTWRACGCCAPRTASSSSSPRWCCTSTQSTQWSPSHSCCCRYRPVLPFSYPSDGGRARSLVVVMSFTQPCSALLMLRMHPRCGEG
jgi:hypothetical protein